MTLERPNEFPEWATNNDSLIKAPTYEKRKIGYAIDTSTGLSDIPSLKGENWFRNLVYRWIKYFDEKLINVNSSISHFSVYEAEKQTNLNKWENLKSFNIPKGKWLFIISFRHLISRQSLMNNLNLPIIISGISKNKDPLTKNPTLDEIINKPRDIITQLMGVNGLGNNLYFSNLAKEQNQQFGNAVENICFSCVINSDTDAEYYVKNFYLCPSTASDAYKVFFQINAIKIG